MLAGRRSRTSTGHGIGESDDELAGVGDVVVWTCTAAGEADGMVAVLTFVGGDDNGMVVGGSLHPLLHCASAVCAPVVAPAFG